MDFGGPSSNHPQPITKLITSREAVRRSWISFHQTQGFDPFHVKELSEWGVLQGYFQLPNQHLPTEVQLESSKISPANGSVLRTSDSLDLAPESTCIYRGQRIGAGRWSPKNDTFELRVRICQGPYCDLMPSTCQHGHFPSKNMGKHLNCLL